MSIKPKLFIGLSLFAAMMLVVACGAQPQQVAQSRQQIGAQANESVAATEQEAEPKAQEAAFDEEQANDHDAPGKAIELSAVALPAGEKLKVVATTNIVGDLVRNVGGDMIVLTTMLPPGADPHTFAPTPRDVAAVADAHVVFINGLQLEEFLAELIENAGGDAPVAPVSINIETREFGEMAGHAHGDDESGYHNEDEEDHAEEGDPHDEGEEGHEHKEEGDHHAEDEKGHADEHGHHHAGIDPHVWTTPANAVVMVHSIERALRELDPANAAAYAANAAAYAAELEALDSWVTAQIAAIPEENRQMVTDHDAFGYYADRYGLDIVGTVIPAYSANAEPSAQELAKLQETISEFEAQAVFVGTTVNSTLAERVAEDTGAKLVPLYTGSLGPADSGVETYIDYIRYNTEAIVGALQ